MCWIRKRREGLPASRIVYYRVTEVVRFLHANPAAATLSRKRFPGGNRHNPRVKDELVHLLEQKYLNSKDRHHFAGTGA